jgi:hypothetical protein
MQDYFEGFVSEDTEQAWQKLKSEMPWNVEGVHSTAIMELGLKSIELDVESDQQVGSLLERMPRRCLWFEYYVHPFFTLGHEDFYPFIINCQQISLMEGIPSERTRIYRSDKALPAEERDSAISFLAISCIRCQIICMAGDFEAEFDPDENEDWVLVDCPACHGDGEWVYDPIS